MPRPGHPSIRLLIVFAVISEAFAPGPVAAEPPAKGADASTVVAEGTGIDEKEAKRAAYREAVSKVVGTLVDAETLVKNDEVISERILEFSGGFIKTAEVLKTDKVGALVRVRIRATVERSQVLGKLSDAKIATTAVQGESLLAEKLTKEDARKGAAELLAKLYAELPKTIKTEVVGKPELTDDGQGVNVTTRVSVDMAKYNAFVKQATGLLDKVCTSKSTLLANGEYNKYSNTFRYESESFGGNRRAAEFFGLPRLGQNTPRGYAIWLLVFLDQAGVKARWNLYWVDADIRRSLEPLMREQRLHVRLSDSGGGQVSEDEVSLREQFPSEQLHRAWFLWHIENRRYEVDNERRDTVTLFVCPFRTDLTSNQWIPQYLLSLPIKRKIRLTNAELERFRKAETSVELHELPARN